MKERIKTYSFWTSLSAAVLLIVEALGRVFNFGIDGGVVDDIVMSVCGFLVVLGFVKRPKSDKDENTNQE